MMTKFYSLLSTEPTYPETQRAAVTTQFALMIEPPYMCACEYRSDFWIQLHIITEQKWAGRLHLLNFFITRMIKKLQVVPQTSSKKYFYYRD